MANLDKVVYLSEAQKETLFTNGSITVNEQIIEYSDTDLYVTPSAIDTVPAQGSSNLITSGAVYNAIDEISDQVDQIKPSVTTAGSIAYYNDTNGTFASDENLTWDSTNQTLTANKLNGYVIAGQRAGTILGTKATAEGNSTTASGEASHAEGTITAALGSSSHAEGFNTTAFQQGSHAEGWSASAVGTSSHAEGYGTRAFGDYSHTEGYGTSTQTSFTVTVNSNNNKLYTTSEAHNLKVGKIINYNNIYAKIITIVSTTSFLLDKTIGDLSNTKIYLVEGIAYTNNSHVENQGTIASGLTSHAEGSYTIASGDSSHAEGSATIAIGNQSHAEGNNTQASGSYTHAEGYNTIASASSSHAEGYNTKASGNYSHAEGNISYATGVGAHSEGYNGTASGQYSHREGYNTGVTGNYGHVEGQNTYSKGRSQHVFGEYNIEDASSSAHARAVYVEIVGNGNSTTRSNARTLDWGGNEVLAGKLTVGAAPTENMDVATKQYVDNSYTIAGQRPETTLGSYATAEGQSTTASGTASHAEGRDTTASGNYSHAEGRETTASSGNSHAEGYQTTASNTCSHTEGYQTTASGYTSHVEGYGTTANHRSQHVFGEYNIVDDSTATVNTKGNYIEIIGNGTSDNARSNARTLDWNGNEVLAGKLTVGANPTEDMDVATKQYVDNKNQTITISGSTPTINALSNTRYVCGEVTTLDITLPASGIVDIVFISGSTPTALTVTPPNGVTLKWANGFNPMILDANTTYEINIMDGLGVVAQWT